MNLNKDTKLEFYRTFLRNPLETTLVCPIAEQGLLSQQVLNRAFIPAHFLFSAYIVA